MKRIDEKIKEIEKKDKTNRWAYYIIVAILAAFLIYASTTKKKMDIQADQIDELTIKATTTYKDLAKSDSINKKLYDDLKNSLRPEEYWNHTRSSNTVEGYISYITNEWGIDKSEFISQAYNRLLDNDSETKAVGYDGWLFVGSMNNEDEYTSGNSDGEKTIKIIYRNGEEGNIANSEPLVGDVVQLVDTRNRNTYSRKDKVGKNAYRNEQGFRNKTKAIVVERHEDPSNTNFYVRLKYY